MTSLTDDDSWFEDLAIHISLRH